MNICYILEVRPSVSKSFQGYAELYFSKIPTTEQAFNKFKSSFHKRELKRTRYYEEHKIKDNEQIKFERDIFFNGVLDTIKKLKVPKLSKGASCITHYDEKGRNPLEKMPYIRLSKKEIIELL